MIHSIFPVQFTCLTVFLHNFCPSPLWSTSWSGTLHFILHTFLHPLVFFWNTCPCHITTCFAVVLKLSSIPGVFLSSTWNSIFYFKINFYTHRLTWIVLDKIQRAVKRLCVFMRVFCTLFNMLKKLILKLIFFHQQKHWKRNIITCPMDMNE